MPEFEPMIELVGNAFELSRLELWSLHSNFSFYAIKKKSEEEREKYYLKSPRLTARRNEAARGLQDEVDARSANEITRIAAAIREEAKILIAKIKAAAKLRGLDVDTIDVGLEVQLEEGATAHLGARWYHTVFEELFFRIGWFWKENDDIIHFMGAKSGDTIEVEIGPSPLQISQEEADTLQELKRHQLPWPQLDSALSTLEECVFDPHSAEGETFFHFGGEPSWNNLYNTFEMIKFDLDGDLDEKYGPEMCAITREQWATPTELEAFRSTANNPNAEGRPRHSSAYYNNDKTRKLREAIEQGKEAVFRYNTKRREDKRKNNPPKLMSLFEADRLITRIFRNWCSYKAKECLKGRLLFGASVACFIAHQANLFQKY